VGRDDGSVGKLALRLTGWDDVVAETLNVRDYLVWVGLRDILTHHSKLALAIASESHYLEPDMPAESIFMSDPPSDTIANPTAQNRTITALALNWSPILDTLFKVEASLAASMLGAKVPIATLQEAFGEGTSIDDVFGFAKLYAETKVAAAAKIDTADVLIATFGDGDLLYATSNKTELAIVTQLHPAEEYTATHYAIPCCSHLQVSGAAALAHVGAHGVTGEDGVTLVRSDLVYEHGLAITTPGGLLALTPVKPVPVYILVRFTIKPTRTASPVVVEEEEEEAAATSAGAAPLVVGRHKKKSPKASL
jgi:hypothetical protein